MKISRVPLQELSLLQDLIRAHVETAEDRVRILEKVIPTEWGSIMLGIDHQGRPVIILPCLNRESNLLSQLIGVYGWLSRSMPLLTRFCAKGWLDGAKVPRVMVLAPGYSSTVLDGFALLSFTVEAYQWRALEISGELNLYIEPIGQVSLPQSSDAVPVKSEKPLDAFRLTDAELQFFQ